jgi:hypothetical protein
MGMKSQLNVWRVLCICPAHLPLCESVDPDGGRYRSLPRNHKYG